MVLYIMILVLSVLIFLCLPSRIPGLVEPASTNVETIYEITTRGNER